MLSCLDYAAEHAYLQKLQVQRVESIASASNYCLLAGFGGSLQLQGSNGGDIPHHTLLMNSKIHVTPVHLASMVSVLSKGSANSTCLRPQLL